MQRHTVRTGLRFPTSSLPFLEHVGFTGNTNRPKWADCSGLHRNPPPPLPESSGTAGRTARDISDNPSPPMRCSSLGNSWHVCAHAFKPLWCSHLGEPGIAGKGWGGGGWKWKAEYNQTSSVRVPAGIATHRIWSHTDMQN